MLICFWVRESKWASEHAWGKGREKEGDTESGVGSRLRAVSTEPEAGLELTNHEIMTWAESWTLNQLSHPGTPNQFWLYSGSYEWCVVRTLDFFYILLKSQFCSRILALNFGSIQTPYLGSPVVRCSWNFHSAAFSCCFFCCCCCCQHFVIFL